MFIFVRERETKHKVGEATREGDTKSEAGCRLWSVSTELDLGLEPTDGEIKTQAKVGHLTEWATQAPVNAF